MLIQIQSLIVLIGFALFSCNRTKPSVIENYDTAQKYEALGYTGYAEYDSVNDKMIMRYYPKLRSEPDSFKLTFSVLNEGASNRYEYFNGLKTKVLVVNPEWNTEDWSAVLFEDSLSRGDTLKASLKAYPSKGDRVQIDDSSSYAWSWVDGVAGIRIYTLKLSPLHSGVFKGVIISKGKVYPFMYKYVFLPKSIDRDSVI